MCKWLLLHYKIPSEPSALRVYIWRKLKRMGAILYQDAVWILPCNPRTLEQFQWLAAEIVERGGEAAIWEALPALAGKGDTLTGQFIQQVDQIYQEIISKLEQTGANMDELSRQYQQTEMKDYFQSALGKRVKETLLRARGVEK